MLTVRDIANLPGLGLELAAGATGADNPIRWVHVSELPDPTPWLEGGELLITTGLGIGELSRPQREYVRRLAGHGLAGLAFGVGFGWAEPPAALADEAERLDFPLVTVPYEVPFIALTKAISSRLANAQLARLERALEVHERLADSVLEGQGAPALLAILGDHVGCALALVDEAGRVVGERHSARLDRLRARARAAGRRRRRDLVAAGRQAAARSSRSTTASSSTTASRRSPSSSRGGMPSRPPSFGSRATCSRTSSTTGSTSARSRAGSPRSGSTRRTGTPRSWRSPSAHSEADDVRSAAARLLDARGARYLSASRRDRAAFLVATDLEEDALTIARELVEAAPGTRVGVGRPASGSGLGRSLLEARAALDAVAGPVASYQDLGSLELLLSLPGAALEAFVARVLGPASENTWLLESLAALLDTGCRWSDAADRLGVHRHTLRYRMDQLRKQTGRHPDDPAQRMELWLAVKAKQAIAAREAEPAAV